VDKDNYSLEPSNDHYVNNPYGAYRNIQKEEERKEKENEEEQRAKDLVWLRREQMKEFVWDRGYAPEPPVWHSPHRSPYNHYNGNRRWE
jgi:hypothetical protein